MSVLSKIIYIYIMISIKIPTWIFIKVDNLILKFTLEQKEMRLQKKKKRIKILEIEKQRRLVLSFFKIFYKSTVIKQVCFGVKINK